MESKAGIDPSAHFLPGTGDAFKIGIFPVYFTVIAEYCPVIAAEFDLRIG